MFSFLYFYWLLHSDIFYTGFYTQTHIPFVLVMICASVWVFLSVALPSRSFGAFRAGFPVLTCCGHLQAIKQQSADQYLKPALTSTLCQTVCYPMVVAWELGNSGQLLTSPAVASRTLDFPDCSSKKSLLALLCLLETLMEATSAQPSAHHSPRDHSTCLLLSFLDTRLATLPRPWFYQPDK